MPLLSTYRWLLARHYAFETAADEIHRVRCDDGVRVAVKRFRPKPGAPARRLPVLCVPGLGADSHNFDAPEPFGLAPWLAEQGFDVWAIDLRGTGLSAVRGKAWRAITFDDFVRQDLPAAIGHILETTGEKGLLWVGHSMGGMLLYAMLATGRGGRVAAGVTVGSPLGFPQRWEVAPILEPVRFLGDYIPGLHAGTMLRLLAPLMLRRKDPWNERFLELDHMDLRAARRLMFHAVQDIPRALACQFRDWIDNDAFRSADLSVDYRARLAGAKTPVLLVLAPKDRLGRMDTCRRALELLPNATCVVCCRQDGFSVDFGHIDVLVGRPAPLEVFPKIGGYLAEADRRAAEASRPQHLRVVR